MTLPIEPSLPEICTAIAERRRLVLEAPPGAGKTTRVPRALFEAGLAGAGEILVLEPRRLAARMAARRVAEEMGQKLGETVGCTMRFEDVSSSATRIRFVTEGVLTRRLVRDPALEGVSVVVLDEFHERHVHADVALALLARLTRERRKDLGLVVMSATLEADPIAAWLDAPIVRSMGRMYDVAIEHLERSDDRPLEAQVASAVRRLVREGLDGDVLVFLPGAAEIRRAGEALRPIADAEQLLVLPLHGMLTPAEQDRAVRPADRRKIILSTNVAESSVTIDGVVAVIDSGLARVASYAPWSGLPTLKVAKIARASAAQRAGRAGRTRPGRALRLFTRGDLLARPEHDAPEILRVDLAETVLELCASGVGPLEELPFLDPPPRAAVTAAEELLRRIGAIDEARRVTPLGRRMLRFPAHPRQARLIVEAEARGVAEEGCVLAALLGEREVSVSGASSRRGGGRVEEHRSDLLHALDQLEMAELEGHAPDRLRALGLDPTRVFAVDRAVKQLARLVDHRKALRPASALDRERALLLATLAGYPDRVGRMRRPETATGRSGREIVFATGGSAVLAESSVLGAEEYVVAVDVEERTEGTKGRVVVRAASAVEADWLLDLFTDAITDTTDVRWNAAQERVEVTRRLAYEGLVLEESRVAATDPASIERIGQALAEAACARGYRTFVRGDGLDTWLARVAFVRTHCPEAGLPVLDEPAIVGTLRALCMGRQSFAELREADLGAALGERLTAEQARRVAEWAPETMQLPGGRRLRLEYGPDGTVSAASRLQDFFGLAEGPRVARGRVPVVLHLCAPNQRPVQVTTDLAGFWERHYPAIARELRRRYPKHAWPDDPRHATPPLPKGMRPS
ncbi:ATP-dependent helicase HrpB [Polyangium jinanense]|uniref:ATP-dependent helicase HrpB n=1 Tax=Polyangium jinanense TaxID=2829994 RepID=A0A9X3X352_9BACT|nr:ATP-dependent helicase HrpB [Polyangium jinanense]MDC3958298.1 ATP-dependent helicase HrpB [Polyangium jinanense]MDC3983367.1 ATP-dependent helicase HrpB [Polyangium jinanense]